MDKIQLLAELQTATKELIRLRKIESVAKQILISYAVGENNFQLVDDLRKALEGK
jgi:hypothetical protein